MISSEELKLISTIEDRIIDLAREYAEGNITNSDLQGLAGAAARHIIAQVRAA